MGSFSKQKGKRGEREVVKLLQPVLTEICEERGIDEIKLFRNQNQSFEGGYDIDGLPWLALEVKRCETLQVSKWWLQTTSQAQKMYEGVWQEPVLIYRKSHMKWRIMMMGRLAIGGERYSLAPVDIALEDFMVWFRERVMYELREYVGDGHIG